MAAATQRIRVLVTVRQKNEIARLAKAAGARRAPPHTGEMKYLLDTDTCIYLINERPRQVFARLRRNAVGEFGRVPNLAIENWA